MAISFPRRFWILACCPLMLAVAVAAAVALALDRPAGESPVSDWVERFCNQIRKSLPAKSGRSVVVLQRFENASKESPEFFRDVVQAVKGTLQKAGLDVYDAASDEATHNLVQKIRDDDLALLQCTLSETLTRLDLSARISYPHRVGVTAVALATLEKRQRARALAGLAGSARRVALQEIYRSAALPLKVLDATIAELMPERPPLVFLLTETALLGYRFENNNLVSDFQVAVPVEPEGLASRDPRGTLALYHHQNRDHILVATHRTGGTYLLREENGTWSFLKVSSDWLFKSRPPAQPLALAARLTAGRNYFHGDVGVLDFAQFAATLESRIRDRREGLADALTVQSPSAVRGKIGGFYQLSFANSERGDSPRLIASGLDGRLRLYDATLREVYTFRDPAVGATLAAYFDAERNSTYLFTTAPSLPATSDALSLFELKDRALKPLAKTNNYPGSVSALGLGLLTGREGLHAVAVLETTTDLGLESVVYIFNLRG